MINISKLYCGLAGESDHLRYEGRHEIGPILVFNSTRRCNLRCLHCYSASDGCNAGYELSTEQAKTLLSQLPEANVPVALFSGGEPLLRADLFELLDEAKKLDLRTVISTNGTLIDEEKAEKFAAAGLGYAGISLDGPEPFHDEFRQKSGSFRAALKGMENCRKFGVKTGLRFTVTKENAKYVSDVFDIAAEAGIRRICFYHLIRTGRAEQLSDERPPLEQVRRVTDIILDRSREAVEKGLIDELLTVGNHADAPYMLMRMEKENSPLLEKARELLLLRGGNKVGSKIACVSWDGTVYADQFWRNYPLGNVLEKRFAEIWYNKTDPVLNKIRDKSHHNHPRCLKCKWFDLCKGNYRFLGTGTSDDNWLNEPACYLTDEEIGIA